MLVPTRPVEEIAKSFGFKKCKGSYGKSGCYYLCVARGIEMIFLSGSTVAINPWRDDDPRIHKNPNCRYSDTRTALDIVAQMVKSGMVDVEVTGYQFIKGEFDCGTKQGNI